MRIGSAISTRSLQRGNRPSTKKEERGEEIPLLRHPQEEDRSGTYPVPCRQPLFFLVFHDSALYLFTEVMNGR